MKRWAVIIVLVMGLASLASVAWTRGGGNKFSFAGHDPNAISIFICAPREKKVEGGLTSIVVFHGQMLVEPESHWSNGTPSSASLRLGKEQFIRWVHRLESLGLSGEWASTYSIATMEDRGPQPSGIIEVCTANERLRGHEASKFSQAWLDLRKATIIG